MGANGKLLPGLPVAIDFWRLPKSYEKFKTYLYFLTHMHTDHTQGLSSTWTEIIYTSQLNKELLVAMLNVRPENIRPLDIGTTYSLKLPHEHGTDEENRKSISVTPLDANHIKGSVMFLFEGDFGRILYTGDFRWCDSMLLNPTLKCLADCKNLDVLYVDNTFEDLGYEFPTREVCLGEVMKIVKDHIYHRIIFGVQTIGKEDVLVKAASLLEGKIYVPEKIRKIYGILGLPDDLFTSEKSESPIWYEPLRSITHFNMTEKNKEIPTIAIALTASGLLYKNNKSPKTEDDDLIHTVQYSNHCSSSELTKFLDFLQPTQVERIIPLGPDKKSFQSAITLYQANKHAELSSDLDESTSSVFHQKYFKSQAVVQNMTEESIFDTSLLPDSSTELAVFVAQPSQTILNGMEEDQNDPLQLENTPMEVDCSSMELASPIPSPGASQLENVLNKAGRLIDSINSDLDQFGDDYIYSDSFIDKLLTLTRLYQPITGVTMKY